MRVVLLALLACTLAALSVNALDFSQHGYGKMADIGAGETVLRDSARRLQSKLKEVGLNFVTAESLTAGKIFSTLVDVAPFGEFKYGSFGVYDSDAKRRFLGVQVPNVYSESCARQMARGALLRSRAMMAVAVTGHAALTDHAVPVLGHVDMAISFRTTSSTKGAIQAKITGLYGGVTVEPTRNAELKWGVPSYAAAQRDADSEHFATYHVHLAVCDAPTAGPPKVFHGFAGMDQLCANYRAILAAGKKEYEMAQTLRDLVRRAIVYAALELSHDLLSLFVAADFAALKLPASTQDSQAHRNDCGEPSEPVNKRLAAAAVVPWPSTTCQDKAHRAPAAEADLVTAGASFLQDDEEVNHDHAVLQTNDA